MKRLALSCTAALLLFATPSFAQDGGSSDAGVTIIVSNVAAADAAPGVTPETVVHIGSDVVNGVVDLFHVAGAGKIAMLIIGILMLVCRLTLRYGKLLPGKVGEWLGAPIATWILPLVLSVGGALTSALAIQGAKFTLDVFIGALVIGLGAGGVGSVGAHKAQADTK